MGNAARERARELLVQGNASAARVLLERAVAEISAAQGADHPETLSAMSDLGVSMYRQGDLRGARQIQRRVLNLRRGVLGNEHRETLAAMGNLAWTLYALGDLLHARDLFRKAFSTAQTALGPGDADTISATANFAWTLQVLGHLDEARKLQEHVLEIRRQTSGDEHSDTIAAMGTLAATLYAQGDLVTARELQEKALASKTSALTIDHPDSLIAMRNLALTMFAQGDLETARELQETVHKQRHRISGAEHNETLVAAADLAMTLQSQGDLRASRELQRSTLTIRQEVFGLEHPETLVTMADLATTLLLQGDLRGAYDLETEVLELRQRTLGSEHPHTLATMANLSLILLRQNDTQGARVLHERVLLLRQRVSGPAHAETVNAMANLAVILAAQGDLPGARQLQIAALNMRRTILGDEHPHTITSRGELASTLHAEGNLHDALPLAEEVIAQRKKILGAQHPDTIAAICVRARMLFQSNRALECIASIRELFEHLSDSHLFLSTVLLTVAVDAATLVVDLVNAGHRFDWPPLFRRLSKEWVRSFLLTPPGQMGGLLEHFVQLHSLWLGLCIGGAPEDIPLALAALQGREMAAALSEDLVAQHHDDPNGKVQSDYLKALSRVRSLRLQFSTLLARDGGLGRGGHGTFERRLLNEHEVALAEFDRLGSEMALGDPDLFATMEYRAYDAATLSALLARDEVLVLLFTSHVDDRVQYFALCCRCAETPLIVELPGLPRLLDLCDQHDRELRRGGLSRTMRGVPQEAFGRGLQLEPMPSLSEIIEALPNSLWHPIRTRCPGARRWHVATHQNLHNLPIGTGWEDLPISEELYVYPGVAFFAREDAEKQTRPGLTLHVDPAWKRAPIPMVEAEAALVAGIVPSTFVCRGVTTIARLREAEAEGEGIDTFAALAHGDVLNPGTGQEQSAILIDADRGRSLDAAQWLSAGARPSMVVLSTCIGARLSEPFGGEPFGLVSALMLRGSRVVVGSLAVIHDFYLPLLTGLFWEAYVVGRRSHLAMRTAKQALKRGNWSSEFISRVRSAFAPAMEEVLRRIDDSFDAGLILMPTVAGWLLPRGTREAFFEDHFATSQMEFAKIHCRTAAARRTFVDASLRRLIDERASLPPRIVDHLCTWVQVFGRG